MTIIDREMKTDFITTEKSQHCLDCQASFNSDGTITLRNYTVENKNSDEIIILSTEETQAIIRLFSKIDTMIRKDTLPY